MDLSAVAVVGGGYLIGSVDFGVIVPRMMGVDIYSVGSGNPGASNVHRSVGRGAAAVVVVGDISTGFGAALLGELVAGEAAAFAAGFAAVLGHCWPLWHRFRGGKGVATVGGMILWVEPLLGLALAITWPAIVALTRRASVASLTLTLTVVPGLALLDHDGWPLVWSAAAVVVILARHHANLRRLFAGSEHTIEGST